MSTLTPVDRLEIAVIKLHIDKRDIKKKIVEFQGKTTLSNLFQKRAVITPEYALLFEKHYNINAVWLIFGRGEMMNPGSAEFQAETVASPKVQYNQNIKSTKDLNDRKELLNNLSDMINSQKKIIDYLQND